MFPDDDNSLPLCMVSLDAATLKPTAVNDLFEQLMGPLYKFDASSFALAASDDKDSDGCVRLTEGLQKALTSPPGERIRLRNIEMTTLAGDNSGFPVRKFFDWFIRKSSSGGELILLGDPCTDQDVHRREQDAELIDFFQNAPIALHWLSGEGKVLWANQTELNVLGYKAEEYIGQDIMQFCPDEKELVLEIFQQLGSGNSIKDVPVRFRTKDNRIVHLLIDSNVKYDKHGSFGHTRCFIRDDTGRKIREARASLLLEETKRSLKMLDNFMARSLHHLRTPLHVTQNMVDAIALYFKTHTAFANAETDECIEMVKMANDQIGQSVSFLDDLSDLAKFDQGAVMHINPQVFDLENFANAMLRAVPPITRSGVHTVLCLRQGSLANEGPCMAVTDEAMLRRVLTHLLNNAVFATQQGVVKLEIGYESSGRLTFAVSDTGPGLEMPQNAAEGDLPVIFQRYHQELLPEDTLNLVIATSLREKIEQGINTHKKTGMGIGLSLTYHLVQQLGGELRCHSTMGEGTRFYFSLPKSVSKPIAHAGPLVAKEVVSPLPNIPQNVKDLLGKTPTKKIGSSSATATTGSGQSYDNTTITSDDSRKPHAEGNQTRFEDIPTEVFPQIPPANLASQGVKCQDPPSILVVEDTQACAKMLCRILSRFKCATKWAENGQIALDFLNEATPGTYDLILMDLRMPVMDGLEATRILKKEMGITTPVVALTGDDNERTREEAEEIGFDAFYGKPLKRDNLKEVIKQFTGYEYDDG